MSKFTFVLLILFVCVTGVSWGQTYLYSTEAIQWSGSGSTNRSQHFSPSESTPNALAPGANFDEVAFELNIDGASNVQGNLYLYNWNTDWNTTTAGAPIVSQTGLSFNGPLADWVLVLQAPSPLSAANQYLLRWEVTSWTPDGGGSIGWGLLKSDSDDGGPNNDAYNNSSIGSAREYQVRVDLLPGVENWELY